MNKDYNQKLDEYIKCNSESNKIFMASSVIKENKYECIEDIVYELFEYINNHKLSLKPLKVIIGEDTSYNNLAKQNIDRINMFIDFE